jgi:hypothetical protein
MQHNSQSNLLENGTCQTPQYFAKKDEIFGFIKLKYSLAEQ